MACHAMPFEVFDMEYIYGATLNNDVKSLDMKLRHELLLNCIVYHLIKRYSNKWNSTFCQLIWLPTQWAFLLFWWVWWAHVEFPLKKCIKKKLKLKSCIVLGTLQIGW